MKMHALLLQNGLQKALKGILSLPETMSDEDEELLEKAYGAVLLCLSNGVLQKVCSGESHC